MEATYATYKVNVGTRYENSVVRDRFMLKMFATYEEADDFAAEMFGEGFCVSIEKLTDTWKDLAII